MNLTLIRTDAREDGIFGTLEGPNGLIAYTLEHAYPRGGIFTPKLPAGIYTCVRGLHQLANMKAPFWTFEITGVPGHTNILIHIGNYNDDSEGCVLVGDTILKGPTWMITDSRITFDKFMALQQGVDEFQLTVNNS
jgi:hypothetical protein